MRALVIGGTGMVGREVVSRLVARGNEVVVMSHSGDARAPAGVQVVRGDLDDAASVWRAMRGVDRVFLLVAQSPNETEQGLTAVAAARDAGVARIVYASVRLPSFAANVPHFASKAVIEQAVRDSGIPFTILRPNNFFQNDVALTDVILRYGLYPQPIGSRGIARVDVRDIADAAGIALTESGHEGEIYELNGPESLTGDDVAAAYGRALGQTVQYGDDDLEAWSAAVSQALPPWLVHDLRLMFENFQRHGMPSTRHDDERLRRLLGRAPRSFDAFAAELVALEQTVEQRTGLAAVS